MAPAEKFYYGKYRGLVTDTKDPDVRGRIKVSVPAIPGMADAWAVPCTPYGGKDVGFYAIPPAGSFVWVEFEGGNIDQPIWVGCLWDTDQVPSEVSSLSKDDPEQIKIFKTRVFSFYINDTDKKGEVVMKYLDSTLSTPVTVQFTMDSVGLKIEVSSSDGTTTIEQKPKDIISNSETLQTNTTGDTTMKSDGNIAETATKSITLTASEKFTAKATQDASIEGDNVKGTAQTNVELTATSNATLKGTSGATVEGGSTAELKGGSSVTISGASVSIN